jgi:catenin alpha
MTYYKVWMKLNEQVNKTKRKTINKILFEGDEMAVLSKEFADDPCSKAKRQQMVIAARALLTSVTHLLILADLVDVQLILKSIRLVEDDLQHIHDASNQEELVHFYKQYGKDIVDLSQHAQRRQQVNEFEIK